jgi:hypothetical protein
MTWLQRYQLLRTLRWSLWLLPVLAIVAVLVIAPMVLWLDRATHWSWLAPAAGYPASFRHHEAKPTAAISPPTSSNAIPNAAHRSSRNSRSSVL